MSITVAELAETCATACDAIDGAMGSMALAIAEIRAGRSDSAMSLLNDEIDRLLVAGVAIDPAPRVNAWDLPLGPIPGDLTR